MSHALKYINAGVYLYRDHYVIKHRPTRSWTVFPMDEEGINLSRVKSKPDATRQIDGFHRNRKKQASFL